MIGFIGIVLSLKIGYQSSFLVRKQKKEVTQMGSAIQFGGEMGKSKSSPPPAPSPVQQAQQISQARDITDPAEAARQFGILSDPNTGLGPTTQLFEQTRQDAFPGESAIRAALIQNVLGNLQSPTGITPQQQTGIDERRGLAQENVVEGLRTRANLGGGLFGGRAAQTEQRAVGELQSGFAEEDIAREERSRLNAIQAALPLLQILFPSVGITPPAFQSAVQAPNQLASSLTSQRGQDVSLQQSQNQMQAALLSSLFGGLGTAAGGALGTGGIFGKPTV